MRNLRNSVVIALGGLIVSLPSAAVAKPPAAPVDPPAAGGGIRPAALTKTDHTRREMLRCPALVPAALNPPPGTTLEAGMAARGVQTYVCTAPAAGAAAPAWVLKAPHAVLSDGAETAATHFAGPGAASSPASAPIWQALDGSRLTGTKVATAAAPDGKSIPWLLLRTASSGGPGRFVDVTWIQRLDTAGGAAPTTGCDAAHLNAEVLVPYRADYFFYHPAAATTPLRRCASN
jgi:Protein of unknown function (DUF3455)